jgi:hypothetical protein
LSTAHSWCVLIAKTTFLVSGFYYYTKNSCSIIYILGRFSQTVGRTSGGRSQVVCVRDIFILNEIWEQGKKKTF